MSELNSPLAAFCHWVETCPDNVFLRQPENGNFHEYTYAEADLEIRKIAAFLREKGIADGDAVALLSKNCAHWFMADLAIMMAGAVSVPLYPSIGAGDIRTILEHSESKAIIVGKLDKYQEQKIGIDTDLVIGIRQYGINDGHAWESIVENTTPLETPVQRQPSDLISIMYTSGTTGVPKGVMHTIRSFDIVTRCGRDNITLPDHPMYFSYLPLSHIAERIGIEMSSIYRGATISFPESLATFADDLAAVQPHTFLGVPRIWQKFKEKILEKMPQKKLDTLLRIPLLNSLVRSRIKKALGMSRAQAIYSGAAPISAELQEWFGRLGIDILQAYGMTEDCIMSHYNIQGENRYGTVGRPLPGVSVRISPEGEILIKNDCLMTGYYKAPQLTAAIFTTDGYLRTGDVGEYDPDGYLRITGRIKDQFKTDKGKFVSPAPIELMLQASPDIEQVCVVGMSLPQPIALVIPSESAMLTDADSRETRIENLLSMVNENLSAHEKVAKAVIMREPWSIENGFMTPTMKVKRNRVEEHNQASYLEWYHREEVVLNE